ncbi:hypothetical protein OG548_08120 [Streptomyces sp. NBC_01356]|uniref:hypothetical protein n=1 Tax=Streptomyces sp. NBC_01356 TaxID=2903836 RepID=UPI002E351C90|nr:hypothetical protein [Streptomyces sp. NBC_01356]
MTYNLRNGFSVKTRKTAEGDTEFQTVNPEGETISTVTLGREAARDLVIDLRVATKLRAL